MHVKKKERDTSEYTLTPVDVGNVLGVTARTVIRFADDGKIDHIRKGIGERRRYLFHPDDVKSFQDRTITHFSITHEMGHNIFHQTPSDESANPVAAEFIASNRKRLEKKGWTEDDFQELMSWYGVGGALTEEGVADRVKRIDWKIGIRKQVEALLESQQAESFAAMVTALYKESIKQQERPPARQSGKPS